MARALTATIQNQITARDIKQKIAFRINNETFTSDLMSWNVSYSIDFGSASASFILTNNDGKFGNGGANKIEVGDIVEFSEFYMGDVTEWKKFYGIVNQRSIAKAVNQRYISIQCLDYISVLKNLDINLVCEGTRVEVVDEVLEPVYLTAPNDDLAQLYNFANNSIATQPIPLIKFRDKNHTNNTDTQYDGLEIYYDTGQLKLGTPLNAGTNYDVISTYSYYTKGKYVEDVLEEIIKLEDGYSSYLFGESSAQDVVDNHLITTLNTEEGISTDTLVGNAISQSLIIETTLAADFDPDASGGGDTILYLVDATGLPSSLDSGQTISVNGDSFSYTGKSGNNLTGVTGLGEHNSGDYCKYTASYESGQVWSTKYDNIQTTLTAGDFTIPGGASFVYFDKRFGRLFLNIGISVASIVTCNTDYSFKTLQATGIEINRIIFRSREVSDRLEAIKKVKAYCAPNYIIRTQGDTKIWASYFSQKSSADYTLTLPTSFNYMEDPDLYTRVKMWAKNKQPTNIMFGTEVDYETNDESSYTGIATKDELSYFGEEKSGILSEWAQGMLDEAILLKQSSTQLLIEYVKEKYIDKNYNTQLSTGYHVYGTVISDDRGKIILGEIIPTVYINEVPIDNNVHQQIAVPIKVKQIATTTTEGGGKSKSVSTSTYYAYEVFFPHANLVPSEPIYLYDNQGVLQYTIDPNDANVNYAEGTWSIPGIERNDVAEVLSTASYYVLYAQDKLKIEYEDVIFKVHKDLIPEPDNVVVKGTFEYWAIAIGIRDISKIVDGRRDTQFQLEFFGNPPSGFHLATIDLGATYDIQAIDLIGGFFRPDDTRKFDIGFRMTMQYSLNNSDFYAISDETDSFEIESGEVKSFEEKELGSLFQARYLKFILEDVDKIEYGRGRYVVALTELSVYGDINIESEATLIATTTLTSSVTDSDTTINVTSTSGFEEPDSASTSTAYLCESSQKSFTYTGLTATTFTGCTITSGASASSGDYVVQSIASDTTLYDEDGLRQKLGDRVYKKNLISDRNLYLESELDDLAKDYLEEFYKNHSKIQVQVVYSPYLRVGQTVTVNDSYNSINQNYFIDSIKDNNGNLGIVLARYP